MGMFIIYSLPSVFSSSLPYSSFSIHGHGLISSSPSHRRCHQLLLLQGMRPIGISKCRFGNFTSKCSVTNADIIVDCVATLEEIPEEHQSLQHDCPLSFVHLTSDVLDLKSLKLLNEESYINFMVAGALERIAELALGVTMKHDSVVLVI